MEGGEEEGTSTGGIAPVAAIVVSVRSNEVGFSADGDPEVTADGGRMVATSMGEDKDKVCTEGGKSKEECRMIDLESIGGCDDKICRICHLGEEVIGSAAEGGYLIKIGCGCKGDLRIAHRRCAEAWFRVKGNRNCEICGSNAKNIVGMEDSSFMEIWLEGGTRMGTNNLNQNYDIPPLGFKLQT